MLSPSSIAFEPVHLVANERGLILSLNERARDLGFKQGERIQKQLVDSLSQRNWIQALAEIPNDQPPAVSSSFSLTLQLHQDQTVAFECHHVDPTISASPPPATTIVTTTIATTTTNSADTSATNTTTTTSTPTTYAATTATSSSVSNTAHSSASHFHATYPSLPNHQEAARPPSPAEKYFPDMPVPVGTHSASAEKPPMEFATSKEIHMFGVITKRSSDHSPFHQSVERRYFYDMSLLDESEHLVIATDFSGRILYYNDTTERVLGWGSDELIGKDIVDTISHESCSEEGANIMAQCLQKGNPWKGRFVVRDKDGTPIPLIVTDYPIFDRNDSLVGILGVSCIDTSKAADGFLQKDPKALFPLVGKSGKSMLIVSADGQLIQWCNDTFLRDVGCASVGQVLNRPLQDFCHPQAQCCKVPEIVNGDTVTTPGGIRSVNIYPMKPSDMLVVSLLDATVQKRLQVSIKAATDLADRNAFKTDFITTMSHEMRTPLHGILAETENMEHVVRQFLERNMSDSSFGKALLDSIMVVNSSSNIQLQLVNNLLDFQKLAHNKVLLDFSEFSMNDCLKMVSNSVRCLIRLKNLSLDISLDPNVPELIVGDRLKVTQIILNFLSNAVKYTRPDTEIKLHVGLRNQRIDVTVSDAGPGIPTSAHHLLFQRFARFTNDENTGGTGLGLSICRQLAEIIGGEVSYRDRPEGGACFELNFPFELVVDGSGSPGTVKRNRVGNAGESPRPTVASPPTPPPYRVHYASVLVVEDNLINQKVMMKMLTKIGFDAGCIRIANDGVEALERYAEQAYPLILMDLMMPRMDGVEATKRLRTLGSHSRIIGVTANAMDEHRDKCRVAGMNGFLVKPVNVKQLEEAIFLQEDIAAEALPYQQELH